MNPIHGVLGKVLILLMHEKILNHGGKVKYICQRKKILMELELILFLYVGAHESIDV